MPNKVDQTFQIHEGDHEWHGGPGWYYTIDDYLDEGSFGPFDTRHECLDAAEEGTANG